MEKHKADECTNDNNYMSYISIKRWNMIKHEYSPYNTSGKEY